MKVIDLLLINPPFHVRNGGSVFFPLGLGYIVASVEKSGYIADVIDCNQFTTSCFPEDLALLENTLSELLKEYDPRLIGIGPCITTQIKALEIIANCCINTFSADRIFAGGPLASMNGQEWFFFDHLGLEYIIKGDGEEAVVDALTSSRDGEGLSACSCITNRTHIQINRIQDLDSLPFPTRHFSGNDRVSTRRSGDASRRTASMITSRGCSFGCDYCVSGNLTKDDSRRRSSENIIAEMVYLTNEHRINDIVFFDDCFFPSPYSINQDIANFCNLITDQLSGLTWQFELRPDAASSLSDSSIRKLEKSGCRQINIGIEKTSKEGLKRLGKTTPLNKLPETILSIRAQSAIKVAGTFILGGPGESKDDILKMIDDSTKIGLDYAHYSPLFIYPGTPLYAQVFKNEKQWVKCILEDDYPWGEIVYENEKVNKDLLLELIDYAYAKFYSNSKHSLGAMVKDRYNLKQGIQ